MQTRQHRVTLEACNKLMWLSQMMYDAAHLSTLPKQQCHKFIVHQRTSTPCWHCCILYLIQFSGNDHAGSWTPRPQVSDCRGHSLWWSQCNSWIQYAEHTASWHATNEMKGPISALVCVMSGIFCIGNLKRVRSCVNLIHWGRCTFIHTSHSLPV